MSRRVRPNINYRKIYEQHHGPIPIDSDGRRYEVHHVDGDHNNNDPNNLRAVTIQEHFNIHLERGDWWACMRIAQKMKYTPEQIAEYSRKCQLKRV
jgi:hypothetical protein